jgi:hypothetical protein
MASAELSRRVEKVVGYSCSPTAFEGFGPGPIFPDLNRLPIEQLPDMRIDEVDLVGATPEAAAEPRHDDDRVATIDDLLDSTPKSSNEPIHSE